MSEETAREIAEREIGRTEDKRKTPERRSYRTGSGRRRSNASKNRPGDPDKGSYRREPGSSAETVNQPGFNRG